jgi:hypothetical protein
MKTFTASFVLGLALSLSTGYIIKQDDRYCGKMVDGTMTVVHNGETITSDVKLDDGSLLKPDGNIVHPDGSSDALQDGECIGKDGKPAEKRAASPNRKIDRN